MFFSKQAALELQQQNCNKDWTQIQSVIAVCSICSPNQNKEQCECRFLHLHPVFSGSDRVVTLTILNLPIAPAGWKLLKKTDRRRQTDELPAKRYEHCCFLAGFPFTLEMCKTKLHNEKVKMENLIVLSVLRGVTGLHRSFQHNRTSSQQSLNNETSSRYVCAGDQVSGKQIFSRINSDVEWEHSLVASPRAAAESIDVGAPCDGC